MSVFDDKRDKQKSAIPEAFVKSPNGTYDFGEITPEISKLIRYQAGKIRLQLGEHKGGNKGYGLEHIKAEHHELSSPIQFVKKVATEFNEIWKTRQGRLMLVLKETSERGMVSVIQMIKSKDGEFYSVVTAFKSRQPRGEQLLWNAAQSHSADTGLGLPSASIDHKTSHDEGDAKQKEAINNIAGDSKKSTLDSANTLKAAAESIGLKPVSLCLAFDGLGFAEKRSLQKSIVEFNQALSGTLAFAVKREVQKRKQGALTALGIIGGEQADENPILTKKKELIAYLKGDFQTQSIALQIHSLDTLHKVYAFYVAQQIDADVDKSFYDLWSGIARGLPEIDKNNDISLFEYYKKSAMPIDIDVDAVQALMEKSTELSKNTQATYSPELKAMVQESTEKYKNLTQEIYSVQGDMMYVAKMSQEYSSLKEKLDALAEERNKIATRLNELYKEKDQERFAEIAKVKDKIGEHGKVIIDALHSVSPITHEQAKSWADKQLIDAAAIRKFNKSNYKAEQVRADMAEFYRLTGGKMATIEINLGGRRTKRAYATGITAVESTIVPGDRFDKETLWHEMAHHLEYDPVAKKASSQFLLKRRESHKLHRLKNLVPGSRYRSDELAYKDDFVNPYIGKYYSDGVTEVFSMGVQYLSSPYLAAQFKAKDTEMFDFITSYLQQPQTFGTQVALGHKEESYANLQEQKAADAESQKVVQKSLDEAIKRLADTVAIVKDSWFDSLEYFSREAVYRWYGKEINYLGSVSDESGNKLFAVFDGKFRKRKTQRMSKGFMVLDIPKMEAEGRLHSERVHVTMDQLKALLKVSMVMEGNDFYQAAWKYFGWDGNNLDAQKIFKAVEKVDAK